MKDLMILYIFIYSIRVLFCIIALSASTDKKDLEENLMVTNMWGVVMFAVLPFYITYWFWKKMELKLEK